MSTRYSPLPGSPGYDPRLPTPALPGTDHKIQVLEDRAARRLPLFVRGDASFNSRRTDEALRPAAKPGGWPPGSRLAA